MNTNICNLAEEISTCGYKLGEWSGYHEAAAFLRDKSGEAFAAGHDELAIITRKLAEEMERRAEQLRTKYDNEFRPIHDANFEELARIQKGLSK